MMKVIYWIYKYLPPGIRFFISYHLSDKFLVGIIAFVVKNNEILLVRESYQNSWGLPSGYLKIGESINGAIEREIDEELGLKVKVISTLSTKGEMKRPVVTVAVLCRPEKSEFVIDHKEMEEAKWVSFSKISEFIPSTSSLAPYVREFQKSRSN